MDLYQAFRITALVFNVYLIVHITEVPATSVPCKPGWLYSGDKCYRMFGQVLDFNSTKTWTNSVDSCSSEGGQLVSIHSKELQDFLTQFFVLSSKSSAWIGLHDRVSESEFSWIDGSPLNYSSWDNNQPSRYYGHAEEDCVEMRYRGFQNSIGMWNDESCNSLRPYICEMDENTDAKSPDLRFCSIEDGGGWKFLNSCYHVVKEEKSWEDAEKYCNENHKGYLVSVLDNNTEIFLNHIIKMSNISKNVWIGIKIKNNATQKWSSGWHVANKQLNEGLDFVNGTCIIRTSWNAWGTVPCSNKYPFICEKIKYNVPVLQRPPTNDWECPYSGKNWLDLGGESCYYIETTSSRNWNDANYDCGRKGGTLASFLSENETNILHHHVLDTQERLLIGLRRSFKNKDDFEWADGSKVVYQNWHKGEPNSIREECGELWTESMKWNDVPCNVVKGYICKTLKRISSSKFKKVPEQVPCTLALKDDQTYSSGIPGGTVVGIVFCTLLVGLLAGFIVYHYKDNLKRYFTKSENDGYTSAPSLGHLSDKVIWNQQREEL